MVEQLAVCMSPFDVKRTRFIKVKAAPRVFLASAIGEVLRSLGVFSLPANWQLQSALPSIAYAEDHHGDDRISSPSRSDAEPRMPRRYSPPSSPRQSAQPPEIRVWRRARRVRGTKRSTHCRCLSADVLDIEQFMLFSKGMKTM